MENAATLEGIFNDVKDSVERLDNRVAGVERRVLIISHELDRECKEDKVILALPASTIFWAHVALGVIIAVITFRIMNCIYGHGGV
jgi:hypothetical protein